MQPLKINVMFNFIDYGIDGATLLLSLEHGCVHMCRIMYLKSTYCILPFKMSELDMSINSRLCKCTVHQCLGALVHALKCLSKQLMMSFEWGKTEHRKQNEKEREGKESIGTNRERCIPAHSGIHMPY